jgi:hypothetical protein
MMTIRAISAATRTDAELVGENRSGNRDAFGQIVSRYQSLVCSLAYSATGSLSQSEDLAQEMFVAAWKQLADLREPGKLRAGLCGIALGVWTCFGGLAIGWQAAGCFAIAWKATAGDFALAHDFALGRIAHAAQANTDIARQFIESNLCFRCAHFINDHCLWLNLLWIIPMFVPWRIMRRAKRAKQN